MKRRYRPRGTIKETLKRLRAKRRIEATALHRLHEQCRELREGLRKMTAFADRLKASVGKLTTVKGSVSDLLDKLIAQIRDNVEDPAALNAILDELEAETDAIAQDVVDNTPAAV